MNSFIYKRAANQAEALREVSGNKGAKFLAGGTNLIDLMKMNVQQPNELVDINRLALKKIEKIPTGLRIAALDAVIRVEGPQGAREIPITEFHRLPGDTPEVDTNLQPDELIVAVDLPSSVFAKRSGYLKVRDRAQYAFALVSVAVGLAIRNGKIEAARLAMGGVAHKPWRSLEAERVLTGAPADAQTFKRAAEAALAG